ncbi:MAG: endonuclease/exonuclease/phosphatase family protein [Saprospiraceae bacterium]|nr:endonuclease/exonuclease/phosphatase family protein [Saprospiraceae bacterium]
MARLNFLFWNLAGKDLGAQVENLVRLHSVDVLILAENSTSGEAILTADLAKDFVAVPEQNAKVQIYSKLPPSQFFLVANEPRYTVRLLSFDGMEEMLLVALHLPSKINMTEYQQSAEAYFLNMNLAQIERDFGIQRTIVVGDFNMHPFDYGMVSHAGFNAVMTRKIAQKQGRKVQFEHYPYFYNPMWGFFGDREEAGAVPGTLYKPGDFNWHLFDQLLIRPTLLGNFVQNELKILTGDGKHQFLTKNGAVSKLFSDHLPLKFSLNF